MQLNLLNVNDFIQSNDVLEVTSVKMPSKTKQYTEPTLWSVDIFGRIGSAKRKSQFGYISLNTKIINPPIYRILKSLNSSISAIMDGRKSYKIDNGKVIESETGSTGISFLIKNLDDIDIEALAKPEKRKEAAYLNRNKHLITIDKYLVIPAESRDLDINGGNASISELNTLYLDILSRAQDMLMLGDEADELSGAVVKNLQWSAQKVYNWLSSRLTGKKGIFRSNLLKKSTDFSSRLILASSPAIKFGTIGVPWFTLISLYEPLFFYHVKNKHPEFEVDILEYLKITNVDRVSNNIMKRFTKSVNEAPKAVPDIMKSRIKEYLAEFMPDQVIVYKRDPALSRKSWASATPVIVDGGIATLNSLDLGPLGGDCITGKVSVFEQDPNGFFLEKIIDICEFGNLYNTTPVSVKTRPDGIVVREYTVESEVFTRGINPQTGALTCSLIKKWWIHENLDMYRIEIAKSRANISRVDPLNCSSGTSLLAYNPETCEFVGISPLDINKSSKLMMIKDTRKSPTQPNLLSAIMLEYAIPNYDSKLDSSFGWFIGAWLGDGSMLGYDKPSSTIAFSNCDPELHTVWANAIRPLTNNKITEYTTVSKDSDVGYFTDSSRKAKRTTFNDNAIRTFMLAEFGKRSGGKTVPNWVLTYTDEFAIGLIAGIIDTDASVTTNYMTMTSKSQNLIDNIKYVLDRRFNIPSTTHQAKSNNGMIYPTLSVRISTNDSLFWAQVAEQVINIKVRSRILSISSKPITVRRVMKYIHPGSVIKCKPDAHRVIKSNYMSTTMSCIFNIRGCQNTIAESIMTSNHKDDLEIVPVSGMTCTQIETTTAYDFTTDPSQRSFITASRLIVKNSDGDAILIAPLFSEEAKKAANEKMNPAKSASKWKDTNSNTNIVYTLSLDTTSSIFHATKE